MSQMEKAVERERLADRALKAVEYLNIWLAVFIAGLICVGAWG